METSLSKETHSFLMDAWDVSGSSPPTVDGRIPAPVDPIIYKVLYIPGGAGFLPSTVQPHPLCRLLRFLFFWSSQCQRLLGIFEKKDSAAVLCKTPPHRCEKLRKYRGVDVKRSS